MRRQDLEGVEERYLEDCQRMVDVAKSKGVEISLKGVEKVWFDYSERWGAGWVALPVYDNELWYVLKGKI